MVSRVFFLGLRILLTFYLSDFVISISIKKDVFGTKTAYKWVFDASGVVSNYTASFQSEGIQCEAVHVSNVVRHGSRYPSLKDMRKMTGLLIKLKTNKEAGRFPFLDKWTNNYPEKDNQQLVQEGKDEMEGVGARLAGSFDHLFNDSEITKPKIISSYKDRAKDSAKYFYKGFAGHFAGFKHIVDNKITRFYDGCKRFEKSVEDNETYFKELHDFQKGSEYSNVSRSIEKRLGFKPNVALTADEVHLIYEMCAFEMYIYKRTDWCTLMTDEERAVIEYSEDIEVYYEKFYGHPVITEMACPLVSDIFQGMDDAIAGDKEQSKDYARGIFRFGHSETLGPVYAVLRLFKDIPSPSSTNMAEMQNRKLRSSRILPMAANLALVLYRCVKKDGSDKDYKVKIYVNEEEEAWAVPACVKNDNFICPYTELKQYYKDYLEKCNLAEVCVLEQPSFGTTINPDVVTMLGLICFIFIISKTGYGY